MLEFRARQAAPWLAAACMLAGTSRAQTSQPASTPAAEPAGLVIDGIRLSAQFDAGLLVNPARPGNGLDFGHLFTDRANQFVMNQALLTAQKEIPKDANGFEWGFKLQFLYGTDARYTHFLGELDHVTDSRYQLDIVEANVQAHLPYLTAGGVELKAGQYPTPLGYETIDPSTNLFYSHSYIFNFGLPLKHTGVLTTTHVTPAFDFYLGVDSGTNTSLGRGDNNGAAAAVTGFGLNLMDGKVAILALTHFGPENAARALSPTGFNANGYYRFYNDVMLTVKPDDTWTFVTEANWVRDDFLGIASRGTPAPANGFGIAQYVSYALSETLTLNGRGEIWRDDNNVFVAAFGNSLDPVRLLGGFAPAGIIYTAAKPTTYGEITLGVTYRPKLPSPVASMMIRPEVRWDHAFSNSRPFNQSQNGGGGTNNAFTFGSDVVISF
jgi:hypothetical protein